MDPKGDVSLSLDAGMLQVSSKALCLSSSTFSAMLGDGSRFWEGSDDALDEAGVRNVTLRDDDYASMEILMRIIHHRNDEVPQKVSFQQLKDIAVVCDKYALRSCVLPWSHLWSQPYVDHVEKDGFESWLFISTVFRNQSIFTRTTKHLILNAKLSKEGDLSHGNVTDLSKRVSDSIIGEPGYDGYHVYIRAKMTF
jgi:hypothetical protein